MEFNVSKCNVMHLTRSKTPIKEPYYMHGKQLEAVTDMKYLGITIKDDLSWNLHINNSVASANQAQGMLSRNTKKSPQQTKTNAVNALRPRVEYGAAMWDPYTQENIDKIERVQRIARYIFNNYSNKSSVTGMISKLNRIPLYQRRVNIRLCLFYKIVNGLVAIPTDTYLSIHHLQPKT
ncbi:Hypothetical predicted protein [Mytilus galloprovincialis]|uniref:Reverse transcriptase domain-containing protein n=1 Tax=Mytilus galloprovincialis TaxID=29158 RepID=A0A8B6FQ08_MYTGA|nr:Hypothetical predicted protein [Mytilus galloprovincialis]